MHIKFFFFLMLIQYLNKNVQICDLEICIFAAFHARIKQRFRHFLFKTFDYFFVNKCIKQNYFCDSF